MCNPFTRCEYAGFDYPLLGPYATIDDTERAPSLLALAVLTDVSHVHMVITEFHRAFRHASLGFVDALEMFRPL